jgi:GntR family transcriptional regulator of arabinose operon
MGTIVEKIKYRRIYRTIHENIVNGDYQNGQRLPSGNELAKKFSASRPTVSKALGELQKAGLIESCPGSGTYIRYPDKSTKTMSFGLLIPGLRETEIFESICGYMIHIADDEKFILIWGGSIADTAETRRRQIELLTLRYVQQKVDGVFFTPLELTSEKDPINTRIVNALDEAKIPIVLMDRDIVAFPNRSKYDLISVDNFRIGYLMAKHLIDHGYPVVKFVAKPYSAPTVLLRMSGFQEALRQTGSVSSTLGNVSIGDVDNLEFVRDLVKQTERVGIVCANDTTAAQLMHSLSEMGYDIPKQVAVVGVDDIKYAKYLRVPLTTYRQNCQDIAKMAINLMLSRVSDPSLPPRQICLDGELITRKSCGCE